MLRSLKRLIGSENVSTIFVPSLIRFGGGMLGGVLLLFIASRAHVEAQYARFVYLQNLAVVIATISKLGVDTLILTDEKKEFRLGRNGSILVYVAMIGCALVLAGLADPAMTLATFCLSSLTVQNALKTSLATRDGHYLRAALESAWVMPTMLVYVLARQGHADAWEIAVAATVLFGVRLDSTLSEFMFAETKGGLPWKTLSFVWLFQVLNIGLFRLDQSLVAAIGARGGGSKLTADLLFWAKANDLANAVATAVGGMANREEILGRSSRTVRMVRWAFPAGCLFIYLAAWGTLSLHIDASFLSMGICSLVSAALSYEVNRLSFSLMWRREYAALVRAWAMALAGGGIIAAFGLASGQTWMLSLAVAVQLFLSIAVFKITFKVPA